MIVEEYLLLFRSFFEHGKNMEKIIKLHSLSPTCRIYTHTESNNQTLILFL